MRRKDNIDLKYNFGVYFELVKKYKLLGFFLLACITIIEILAVADRFLFKFVIDAGTGFFAGDVARGDFVGVLILMALIFGVITIVRTLLSWIKLRFINNLDGNLIRDLKRKSFNHLLNLSHKFHTSKKTGSLISRIIRGSSAIERLTDVFAFNFIPVLVRLVVISASFIYFDIWSAVVVVSTVVLFTGYSVLIQNRQREPNWQVNAAEDREKGAISDVFTNIDTIKYFGKEKRIMAKYGSMARLTKKKQLKFWHGYSWMDAGQVLILGIGTFLLIYASITRFLSGAITIGDVSFIYTAYLGLIGPLYGLVHGIRGYQRGMVDLDAIAQYYKMDRDVQDVVGAKDISIRRGGIDFENVSFSYDGKRSIFKNFNINIPSESKVAIVGLSGSGKSTLVKLLYRLYDLEKGKILIDGKDISKVKQESLRSEMSIVPQECILFDDTIYNNIAFSKPGATPREVWGAIRKSQLGKFIKSLPRKELTLVGERGVKLSGGEKQRVSIARAILADKKIMVLDEATSSLDSETEHEIQQSLEQLMDGRTTIIIAHRLSTVMRADQIIVVKNGRIVQVGAHKDLINHKGGIYERLWDLQRGGLLESS